MNPLYGFITVLCALVAGSFAAPVNATTTDLIIAEPTGDPVSLAAANVGQATFYQAGLGACGKTNNGGAQDIVALPHGLMGGQSHGNPFCGRKVVISYKGKQASGIVQDKCMGCTGKNIDLSKHLFKKLAPLSAGRLFGVKWHFA